MENAISWLNAGSTLAIALMAVATTAISFFLFRENRILRKAETEPEPECVAYLEPSYKDSMVVNFVITNIGRGTARNVVFSLQANRDEFKENDIRLGLLGERMPFKILRAGKSVEFYFGIFPELFNEDRCDPLKVLIEYETLGGDRRKQAYDLDVSPFIGSRVTIPPEYKIADSLGEIKDILRHSSSGFRRLKVETITSDEQERRYREAMERQNQLNETQQPNGDDSQQGG